MLLSLLFKGFTERLSSFCYLWDIVTNDNYPVVIGLLKERFGEKEHIVQVSVTVPGNFNEVKITCKQFESQRRDIRKQQIVVQQIIKVPCRCRNETLRT